MKSSSKQDALARLAGANPISAGAASRAATPQWRDRLLREIAEEPTPAPRAPRLLGRRLRLVFAVIVLALLAVPSYGVARDVIEWVRGEPAPQSVVEDFESYAPQLGFQPDAGGAVLVAVENRDVRLYSTKNDKGSYCLVLTAPGRPSGDGGTCIKPAWAKEPLIAGTLGATAGDDKASTHFIAGRTTHPRARSVRFADPGGRVISRPIGFDGFFVASVRIPRSACGSGDWRPPVSVQDRDDNEVARAAITLMFSLPSQGVCGFISPHPPSVK